jgi:serine/threonine-protein kinase HipA
MKKIEVWADWHFLPSAQKVGILTVSVTRGREIISFEYDRTWIKGKYKFQIDPQLLLYEGPFHATDGAENFGVFLDSSPDRWGRTLMHRREALLAKEEKRPLKTLRSSDFLLGVYDLTRMGGLRFKLDGLFVDCSDLNPTPPWTSLRELENACFLLESDTTDDNLNISSQLKLLFTPGSSLGGARPKANVLDVDKHLWIAKFPSKDDLKDVGAWEAVANMLAKRCKINLSESKVQKFAAKHHTFLTKRFDRLAGEKRIHFASAMTLLERRDGDSFRSGVSYLEFVDFIIQYGAASKVSRDLEEMWRRIVFSIAITNSDDHLRNHGFLLSEEGWELSPAYDINPNEDGSGLSLNISWDSNALDYDLALDVAADFRIAPKRASEIVAQIKKEVRLWREVASEFGISRSEQERMSQAFRSG